MILGPSWYFCSRLLRGIVSGEILGAMTGLNWRCFIVVVAASLACGDSSSGPPTFQSSGPCDAGLALAATDPRDAAHALGICDGLVSAAYVYPDGTPDTAGLADFPLGHGLSPGFGANNAVREGQTLVVLSSGAARTPAQAGYVAELEKGYNHAMPEGGFPHHDPSCPGIADSMGIDGIALQVVLEVPAGVHSFAFDYAYFSRDYPNGGCTAFVDQAAAIVAGLTGALIDQNVLLDRFGNPMFVSTSSMSQCVNGTHNGQAYTTCEGTTALVGTGFDNNGGTGWLRTADLPVTPGDTVRIRFTVWDSSDGKFDSSVLLDNFKWKL